MELLQASEEWAKRPDDERYLSLEDLLHAVQKRQQESWTVPTPIRDIRVKVEDGSIELDIYDPVRGGQRQLAKPTNWGFGNLASYAGVPAAYLRKLPAELAAINLQYGLENLAPRPDALVLGQSNGANSIRALTSQSYGRIWDREVVELIRGVAEKGDWKVPSASYSVSNPKRATTLYASDRDVFVFLVDDQHPIEVAGETLFRGFFCWNSEVGSAVFGLTTFLYRTVCDNRIVWGASEVQELKIRHTAGAPERFRYEGTGLLERYANESTFETCRMIQEAKRFEIPKAAEKGGVEEWLKARGFTSNVAKSAVESAQAEEGEARTLWDIINGVTAHARSIKHTNERVLLETKAGKMMELVSGK